MKYFHGSWGLQTDKIKAMELWNQSAELGVCRAHYNLALSYWNGDGVEEEYKKALHHYRLAAIGGHESARHMLGCLENDMGNLNRARDNMCRAMKHYMIAAGSGFDESLKAVGEGYKTGWVTKGEYASTQVSIDEMKSEQRTEAMKHKKS